MYIHIVSKITYPSEGESTDYGPVAVFYSKVEAEKYKKDNDIYRDTEHYITTLEIK
jgi:hypothetical protein